MSQAVPLALGRPQSGRPATVDGVGPSCVGLPAGNWPLLLDYLAERFAAQPREEWVRRMRAGKVLDDGGQPVDEHRPYRGHTRVYYYRDTGSETPVTLDAPIVYRDSHLLVVDKPHGIAVVPSCQYLHNTLLVQLRRELGIDTLTPIHRIDRDTAGLVMFSLQPDTRDAYHALFRQRQVQKVYEAVAAWRADLALPLMRRSRIGAGPHFLQQCELPGLANAVTELAAMRPIGTLALYRLHPHTGQRHQLRVHMAAWGMPIVGDGIYPTLLPEGANDPALPLQLLARSLTFTDPVDGTHRHFTSRRALALARINACAPDC